MKILAVLGSPHKEGNTAAILSFYLAEAVKKYPEAEVENIYLQNLNIKGCQACFYCKKADTKTCIINDDMTDLYPKINDADVLIFATPIYWWNMTSQMKTFIDRLYALDFRAGALKGKKLVFLTTYGAPEYNSSGAYFVEQSLASMAKFTGMEFTQRYGVCSDDTPDNPLSSNEKVLADIKEIALTL
ncbi:MAG: flavodoxin family protein [Candidatus Stygibacter australis]|nr:flavodoxin family protein [Candidatus Stygibacter australis]MDP8323219.1 flavodoxin family protein [Candidatus Stygibacter australis]